MAQHTKYIEVRFTDTYTVHPECAQLKVTGSGTASPRQQLPSRLPRRLQRQRPGRQLQHRRCRRHDRHHLRGPRPIHVARLRHRRRRRGQRCHHDPGTTAVPTSTTLKTVVVTSAEGGDTTGCTVAEYGQCGGMTYTGCAVCGVSVLLGLLAVSSPFSMEKGS